MGAQPCRDDLLKCSVEAFRALRTNGVLIFKGNEKRILSRDLLALTNQKSMFGRISGKWGLTNWFTFLIDREQR